MPNFVYISQAVAIRHLGFVISLFGPTRRVFGPCHCAKFGLNQCSSFDSMQVLIF